MSAPSGWKHQHTSLAIVFTIWMVSYLDRMVMSTAIPFIAEEFELSTTVMGGVMSAFFGGYALCQIPGGILSDKFGARKVLAFAITWWSIFTAVTGAVVSLGSMILARVLFGIGEGLAPAATWRALANWTPAHKRSWANGIMMSTNSLGPALAPLFVVAIIQAWGWRMVFYTLGIPGILVALWVWFKLPDNPVDKPGISKEELAELEDEPQSDGSVIPAADLTFFQVVAVPAVWKSFLILFFSNTTTWGFMAWLPTYLLKARQLSTADMGIYASLPFFAGTVGAILTGWLLDSYFKNNRHYLLIILEICTAGFLYLTYTATDLDLMILFNICTGFFVFCCVATVFSLPIAAVPKEIAGRAMGIVNTSGQLAAFTAPIAVGMLIVTQPGLPDNYDQAFGYLCCAALVAAFLAVFYKPRKEQVAK